MENPDGSRFLLNPDGSQIPVYSDELGNSYVIDADGTAVLLQTAEDTGLQDVIADGTLPTGDTSKGQTTPLSRRSYPNPLPPPNVVWIERSPLVCV